MGGSQPPVPGPDHREAQAVGQRPHLRGPRKEDVQGGEDLQRPEPQEHEHQDSDT